MSKYVSVKPGDIVEWGSVGYLEKLRVVAVTVKRVDLNYADQNDNHYIPLFMTNRCRSEIVNTGGKLIWNHDYTVRDASN